MGADLANDRALATVATSPPCCVGRRLAAPVACMHANMYAQEPRSSAGSTVACLAAVLLVCVTTSTRAEVTFTSPTMLCTKQECAFSFSYCIAHAECLGIAQCRENCLAETTKLNEVQCQSNCLAGKGRGLFLWLNMNNCFITKCPTGELAGTCSDAPVKTSRFHSDSSPVISIQRHC